MLEQTTEKAIGYLLDQQRKDGSWNGPLSSRIRETYLVNLLSHKYKWNKLFKDTNTWLKENSSSNIGSNELEVHFNNQFLNLYQNREIDITKKELYDINIIRKTLMLFGLGLIKKINIKYNNDFSSLDLIHNYLYQFLSLNLEKVKGWSLAEILASQIVIKKTIKLDPTQEVNRLIDLLDNNNHWFFNPATTAYSLLCLDFIKYNLDFSKFEKYFLQEQQPDGGFSYCDIPLWDTGLSLYNLNAYTSENQLNLDTPIKKSIEFLFKSQNKDGGWGFNKGIESEADTTSIILKAFSNSYLEKRKVNSMIKSTHKYYELQTFKVGSFKGLWPVWRKSEEPSIEVVSHIVTALKSTHYPHSLKLAEKYLEEKSINGDWAAIWGRSEPYSISAILNAYSSKNIKNHFTKFLIVSQNKDGGWGATKSEQSNASATANAILALKALRSPKFKSQIEKGIEYLCNNQLGNGTWPRVEEVIGPRPFVYADDSSTHNFVIEALL